MLKRFLSLGSICVLAPAMAASASTMTFSLNSSQAFSDLPAGTVTIHDVSTNEVSVSVLLSSDYSFRHAKDSNHTSFVFDLSGVGPASASSITAGPASQTFVFEGPGAYNDQPFGTFNYALNCTSCSVGAPGSPTQSLSFLLTGNGLSTSSFVSNDSAFFAVDVVGLVRGNNGDGGDEGNGGNYGNTGAIGATGDPTVVTTSPVPEPSSLALLGTGIVGVAGMLRRRMAGAISRS